MGVVACGHLELGCWGCADWVMIGADVGVPSGDEECCRVWATVAGAKCEGSEKGEERIRCMQRDRGN